MNRQEILRYLRASSRTEDERLLGLIDDCCNEVNAAVKIKTLHRIFDCTVDDDGVEVNGFYFKSRRLAENIAGCGRVCVFGATLGTECDRLLRIYSSSDIARLAVLQACLASKIEEVCDSLEDSLRAQGYRLRRRFSPGYFDLDISENKKIFELIELNKRIGLTITLGGQMAPSKSVTAFIGVEND